MEDKKQKRKAGQPKKKDAKIAVNFRLHPDVVKIIKSQPNQSFFIEQLVKAKVPIDN